MFNITTSIQNNMVLNKGLLEIGGYAVPSVIMSNNKVEARERAERAALLFGISFLTPFACLPFFNKMFLKTNGVSQKFWGGEDKIMHMSKKYLTKDGNQLKKGIEKLIVDFEKKGTNTDAIKGILKKFPNLENLRKALIKTHSQVFLFDFISSALMMGAIYWGSNLLTKKKTGKEGFSAKFEMQDEANLQKGAKEHEKAKFKKMMIAIGTIFAAGLSFAGILKKGMTNTSQNKFFKFINKHADKFDYKKGMFMSRATLFGIMIFGDTPNTLLASRDKEEFKYNVIKNAALLGTFFGGDLILNNSVAKVIDKTLGTKLIDDTKIKQNNTLLNRITAPLRDFNDIAENSIGLNEKTLKRTKIAGTAMFWGNFAILCGVMGFGLPHVLNKMLKKEVAKEKNVKQVDFNQPTFESPTKDKKTFSAFISPQHLKA